MTLLPVIVVIASRHRPALLQQFAPQAARFEPPAHHAPAPAQDAVGQRGQIIRQDARQ